MKIIAMFSSIAFAQQMHAVQTTPQNRASTLGEFDAFVAQFGKTYSSEAERLKRATIFERNMNRALELSKQGDAEFGVTEFSDQTPEEFSAMYLNYVPPDELLAPPSSQVNGFNGTSPLTAIDVPNFFSCRSFLRACRAFFLKKFVVS